MSKIIHCKDYDLVHSSMSLNEYQEVAFDNKNITCPECLMYLLSHEKDLVYEKKQKDKQEHNEKLIEYLVGGQRFTELKGYKFDKLIFGGFILSVLALFMIMFVAFGSDRDYHIYYFCDADGRDGLRCENPFFALYPICDQAWSTACSDKFVPSGFKFGEPAPWIINNWGLIIGVLLAGAFFVNHFVHNKYFKFGGDAV